jgi:UDP-2,3-diacylglucosamine pyrophosphatase LpxH
MLDAGYQIYDFTDCKYLVACGDIHGDFNFLVNKLCIQYQLEDTVCVVAGDCGFGFENKGYYDNMVRRNCKRMDQANNRIVFVRGNHDNPAYFDGKSFNHKWFIAIPDYSIIKVGGHVTLCIGGAVSVDRNYRKSAWEKKQKELSRYTHHSDSKEILSPNYYWQDEAPVFSESLLSRILAEQAIDTVITHTAPSFCELQSKPGIESWSKADSELLDDIQHERYTMDVIYERIKGHNVTRWCYGHFHQSWHSSIEGIMFKMLDIMELYEIR